MKPISTKLRYEVLRSRLSLKIQAYDRTDIYIGVSQPVLRSITSTIPSI